MTEINHFKVFILCSDDVMINVDHLHVKENSLRIFSWSSLYS
jgi:hypothetical protein